MPRIREHYCPECPAEWVGRNRDRRGDLPLEIVSQNYSGTGADIAFCPRCEKTFQITYKVEVESIKEVK